MGFSVFTCSGRRFESGDRQEEKSNEHLPIIDPRHHLIDRPQSETYLLADIASGHNVVATVYLEWLSMYRADRPIEMRPVGRRGPGRRDRLIERKKTAVLSWLRAHLL